MLAQPPAPPTGPNRLDSKFKKNEKPKDALHEGLTILTSTHAQAKMS